MTKELIHKIFKGYITTVRKNRVIICLGYIDAPENYLKYDPENEKKVIEICKANNFEFNREIKTEYGKKIVRITFNI